MMSIKTVGSICSGIEAASVAWQSTGVKFSWFSEIAKFPSTLLAEKYPQTLNVGDMTNIPDAIRAGDMEAPDLICGGTPCQAFSLTGWRNGLNDHRGNLTLKFVDIIEANDLVRSQNGQKPSIVFWENVEGVLTDKTNAFGCLVSSLAGLNDPIVESRWGTAGLIRGPKRNVAWRVLDAKFFGVPQQRRRLYLLAGGKDFNPEHILFELHNRPFAKYPNKPLTFQKDGHNFEVFRSYTDCLYSAYGTKWNGNAAAFNGSLFVVQDGRIRRISPLESERLMGFPDNYTDIPSASKTNRYQGTGNSWAIPVVRWIGNRIFNYPKAGFEISDRTPPLNAKAQRVEGNSTYFDLTSKNTILLELGKEINCSAMPEECVFGDMRDIVSSDAPESIYISPTACYGIVRRHLERNACINPRLKEVLLEESRKVPPEEIEKRSRIQKRGHLSTPETSSIVVLAEEKKTDKPKHVGKRKTVSDSSDLFPDFM